MNSNKLNDFLLNYGSILPSKIIVYMFFKPPEKINQESLGKDQQLKRIKSINDANEFNSFTGNALINPSDSQQYPKLSQS